MTRNKTHVRDIVIDLSDIIASLEPPISPKFRPPATKTQISLAEKQLGLTFPDDLRGHFRLLLKRLRQ